MTRDFTELHLDVPAQTVWGALVAPGIHEWYHRLTPQGAFAEGETIRWTDVRGDLVEESEVIELEAPRRMVVQSRFMFSPAYARQPPHTLTWEITGEASGCSVRMSWDANDRVAHFLDSEGNYTLQALRLQHDPRAKAEIARLANIGEIEVRDVTPDRLSDYQSFFDDDAFRDFPQWQSCYCMSPFQTDGGDGLEPTAAENRRDMSEKIRRRGVTALLAYVDGQPVGWCNFGATTSFGGVLQRFRLEPAEYSGIGSIACFVIAAPYRGHGVATRLLAAAIERMRDLGVRDVEAYPVLDSDAAQSNFRGPLSMYLKAGFRPYRQTGPYQIVRRTL